MNYVHLFRIRIQTEFEIPYRYPTLNLQVPPFILGGGGGGAHDARISWSYCNGTHPSKQSRVVPDIFTRKGILQKGYKCFKCLRPSHTVRNCTSTVNCQICGGRHHISICFKGSSNFQKATPSRKSYNPPYNPAYVNPPNAANINRFQFPNNQQSRPISIFHSKKNSSGQFCVPVQATTNHGTTNLINSSDIYTLLQTAKAWVSSKYKNSQSEIFRVVFDNCSQQSFVTENLVNYLKIPTDRTERIMVKPFGSTDFQVRALNVVNLKIHGLASNAVNYVEALLCQRFVPLGQVMEAAKSNYDI